MTIIDSVTNTIIENPDLAIGYILNVVSVKPGAYETIDNVTKFALDDSDYEDQLVYYRYTEEELEQIRQSEIDQNEKNELNEMIDALSDAIMEIGSMVAEQNQMNSDIMDAMMELAGMIATSQEGE